MTLKAEVILEWGDGEYLFALKGAQIEELQRVCGDVGFGLIFQRVSLGQFFYGDIKHTIRLGLIGGGMGAVEAMRLVNAYMGPVEPLPLVSGPNNPLQLAKAILGAAMVGLETLDKPKEGAPDLGESLAGSDPASGTSPLSEPGSSDPASTLGQ